MSKDVCRLKIDKIKRFLLIDFLTEILRNLGSDKSILSILMIY